MPATNLLDMETAMKVVFAPALHNNVVADSDFSDWFKSNSNVKTDETTGGRYVEHANRMRVSGGFRGTATGAGAPRDAIPEADPPEFINPRVNLRKHTGTIEMDGDTMRRVKQGEGSWVTYLESELPAFKDRVMNEYDRLWIGLGNGVKARVRAVSATINGVAYTNGVSPTNTPSTGRFRVAIDRPFGVTGWSEAWTLFLEGERLVFTANFASYPQTLKNAGANQSALVVDIDDVNGILELQGAEALRAAIAANDFIGLGDAAGHSFPVSATANREMQGVLAAIDDGSLLGTYHGINRANRRLWNGIVVDANTTEFDGTLTEDVVEWADDQTARRGGGKIEALVTSHSGIRGFRRAATKDRMFVDPRTYVTGAQRKGLKILVGDRQLDLRVARKLPPELTIGLMKGAWTRYTLGAFEWDDTTGSMWNRVTDANGRYDQFYATAVMYEESYCAAPRRQVRIQGLRPIT
jgi:hypothetical protein